MVVILDKNPKKVKRQVREALDGMAKKKKKKRINLRKYLGILKTDIDPLRYQKQIRE